MSKICYDKMFKIMAEKHISPKKLMTKHVVGYSVLIKLINNKDTVQMRSLVSISKFLDCKVDDLFEYKEG